MKIQHWPSLTSKFFIALLFFSSASIALEASLESYGSVKDGVRHVNATEAAAILNNHEEINILDVRTGFEYNRGHLEDSINVNYYSRKFREKLNKLDRNATWLVHCRTGVRSGKSLPIMKEMGFNSIIHLDGGIVAWHNAEQPVVKK